MTASAQFDFEPANDGLLQGTVGEVFSIVISADGGAGDYSYAITGGALPLGLNLSANTGLIAGTPTAAGSSSFEITATDGEGAHDSETYHYQISPPVTGNELALAGGTLRNAMPGEEYSASIIATGGTGSYHYEVDSSTRLPDGIELDENTGTFSGGVDDEADLGDYTFDVTVTDQAEGSKTASFTITVVERAVTAEDKERTVPVGSTPTNVLLTENATGGPFIAADVAFVEPANAGTAKIVLGEFAANGGGFTPGNFYLKFTPNPMFSGRAQVGYTLTNGQITGVTTAAGLVTYNIGLNAPQVAADVDSMVYGFVHARQGMIASSIKVPGLLERRRMGSATTPVTGSATPNDDGLTMAFATSLVQMQAAGNAASKAAAGVVDVGNPTDAPFNVWLDGTLTLHNREQNGDRWGSFAMLSLGADYLVNDKALIGLSFHLDHMTDPTDADAELTGTGWMAGPYASVEVGEGVFVDASLLYGGSANDIDTAFFDGSFDTTRWMFDTSITGQWHLDDVTTLTPKLRAVYFNEETDDYSVSNAAGDTIGIEGVGQQQFRVSLGAEVERVFALENGLTLIPSVGATAGVSTLDASNLFGSLTTGLSLAGTGNWGINGDLLFNFDNKGARSAGAKAGVNVHY